MKIDGRNLVIAGLAGALLVSLWEHARWYLPAAPLGPHLGFHESQFPESVDVFEGGGRVLGPELNRPPAEFHESAVWAEDIPSGTRTGTVLALFDLMGCITQWEFWFERELYQECYARRDGSYQTMGVHYRWISHLRRSVVTAFDNRGGTDIALGQALEIMQRDYEAGYSESERELFEQRWTEEHPNLAGFLEDAALPLAERAGPAVSPRAGPEGQ